MTAMLKHGPCLIMLAMGGSAFAQSIEAEQGLESRFQTLLGSEWTVSSQFLGDTGSSMTFSDVRLQRDEIIVQITTLADFYEEGRVLGDNVSVHYGSLENFPLFDLDAFSLGGFGFAVDTLSEMNCADPSLETAPDLVEFVGQRLLAQPDPSLRLPGSQALGDLQAGSLGLTISMSRQSTGCVFTLSGTIEDLQVISGNDRLEISTFDVSSALPTGDNEGQSRFGISIASVFMGNAFQSYMFDNLEIEAAVPRQVVAAYLPKFYEEPEQETSLREIVFDQGAELTARLSGLDFNLNDFAPGNLTTDHLRGDMTMMGNIRPDGLEGTLSIQMPGAIEMQSNIRLRFTDNVMEMSPIQASFVTSLEEFVFEFHSPAILEDIFWMTGWRVSDAIPQFLRQNMNDLPLIGGSYEGEIDAIGEWILAAEAGERVGVEALPGSPVNLGMVGGIFVLDVNTALSSMGFSASP
ncbi:MAG: hypothetical protein II336_16715 [Loktanella sp.]|nr:hypothetical protein [Loktanella sp.]